LSRRLKAARMSVNLVPLGTFLAENSRWLFLTRLTISVCVSACSALRQSAELKTTSAMTFLLQINRSNNILCVQLTLTVWACSAGLWYVGPMCDGELSQLKCSLIVSSKWLFHTRWVTDHRSALYDDYTTIRWLYDVALLLSVLCILRLFFLKPAQHFTEAYKFSAWRLYFSGVAFAVCMLIVW